MVPRFSLILILVLLPFSALAAIRATPERELTPRQIDLTAFDQANAHIDTDGDSFQTIWYDNGDILGARLDPDGTKIDDAFVIADGGGFPEVAWGGDRYLAVWQTLRSIRGRFIERDGTMSAIFDIAPRHPGYSQSETLLAFNGEVFLVMWRESSLRGAIVDRSGNTITMFAGPMTLGVDLAAHEGTFYLAYASFPDENETEVRLLPIDGSGQFGTPRQLAAGSNGAEKIHIATRGNDMLVAWSRGFAVHNVRIVDGRVGAVESVPVGIMWLENIVVDGAGFLLVYGNNDSKLARRAGAGAVEPFAVHAPTLTIMSDTATNHSHAVAILRRANPWDTMGGDLFVLNFGEEPVRLLADAPRHQELADIAAAGDLSLVTWLEHKTAERKFAVMGMRISRSAVAAATALGRSQSGGSATALPEPIELASMTVRGLPRVASNGDSWLVAWTSDRTLYAVRVAHDGTVLDGEPRQITTFAMGEPAISWDGTSWVIAYGSGVKTIFGISAVRVQPDGSAVPLPVSRGMLPLANPSAASGPNGTLVVYSYINGVEGMLISRSDVVTPLGFPKDNAIARSVAWNGDTFLVAVSNAKSLRWLRVDASGNVSEPGWSIDIALPLTSVRVSPFGDAFLLLWEDASWRRAAIIDRSGQIVAGPVAIGPGGGNAAAAADLIVTSHPIGHPSRASSRVFSQSIESSPQSTSSKRRSVRF